MRRIALVAVLTLGAAFISCSPAMGAQRTGKNCGPPKVETLRRDSRARIYELPAKGPGRGQPTYGCLFSTRHSWRLDLPTGFNFLDSETVALRSPWVAYSITSMGVDGGGSDMSVKNLRTGAITEGFPAISRPPEAVPETFSSVSKIVLQQDGTVAWIGQETSVPANLRRRQVEIADSAGFSVVDESLGIDPESLSLEGSTLTWTDSGETRSAPLF